MEVFSDNRVKTGVEYSVIRAGVLALFALGWTTHSIADEEIVTVVSPSPPSTLLNVAESQDAVTTADSSAEPAIVAPADSVLHSAAIDHVARQGLWVLYVITVLMFLCWAVVMRRTRSRETLRVLHELIQEFERLQEELAQVQQWCAELKRGSARTSHSPAPRLAEALVEFQADKNDEDLVQIAHTVQGLRGDVESLRCSLISPNPAATSRSHFQNGGPPAGASACELDEHATDEALSEIAFAEYETWSRSEVVQISTGGNDQSSETQSGPFYSSKKRVTDPSGGDAPANTLSELRSTLVDLFGIPTNDASCGTFTDEPEFFELDLNGEGEMDAAVATQTVRDTAEKSEGARAFAGEALATLESHKDHLKTKTADVADADPNSIEAYIQHMLERNSPRRSGKPQAVNPPRQTKIAERQADLANVPLLASFLDDHPAEQQALHNAAAACRARQRLPKPPAPVATVDKAAVRAGINSMRELANHSARAAVNAYAWKRRRRLVIGTALLCLATFAAAWLASYLAFGPETRAITWLGSSVVGIGVVTLVFLLYQYSVAKLRHS